MSSKKAFRVFALIMAVVLIMAALPSAALAAGKFSAVVTSGSMKVYKDAKLNSYWGKISKNTIVTVSAYKGNVARITYNGKTGFASVSDMSPVDDVAKKAVSTKNTRVYKSAKTGSASVGIPKGTGMYVLAMSGKWAKVERGGYVGYVNAEHLNIEGMKKESEQESSFASDLKSQPKQPKEKKKQESKKEIPASTIEEVFASGKYSNEELIYAFAVKVMGYNSAAACGIVANIKYESGFKPSSSGDSGTSYGICQWHAGRKTRLINWCKDNGYDKDSLLGQLYYLKYELEKYYPSVHKYLKNVENSEDGAYNAAYNFCYNFEAPANRASKSETRASYAVKTTYKKLVAA